jgi:hypothetical protein
MFKRRILILDCTRKEEPSEGRLLKEFFKICRLYKPAKAFPLVYKINSKKDFLQKLNTGKRYDIIHISAHGGTKRKIGIGNGRTWLATPEEIKKTNHKAELVFVNACLANKLKIAEAFKSKYFLAPITEVEWINAALFSLMFYKRYIVDGVRMRSAFEYARTKTQTCSDYLEYWES